MTPCLKILAPGPQTTVQDFGRFGFQSAGVPVSGALDPVALRIANRLVGNQEGEAGLEIHFLGPTIEVAAESVRVALAGSDASIEIEGGEPARLPAYRSLSLTRGRRFRIGALSDTSTAILAFEGGFALEPELGSLSTYVRGGIGGFRGRALMAGDEIPLRLENAETRHELELPDARLRCPERFRVLLGPQDDYFTEEGLDTLLSSPFTISQTSDRMGMRLDGPAIAHRGDGNIVSDGIATGAIQVPGSGQPIVLLADRQTTGGYPKVANVISADLPALGRLPPGTTIRFRAVTRDEAARARREHEAAVQALMKRVAPVKTAGSPSEAALLSSNLVSGVHDANEI